MAYQVHINGTTQTIPTPADGDDPAEIHIYDSTGRMIAAIDLSTQQVNLIQFDQDGDIDQTITVPANR